MARGAGGFSVNPPKSRGDPGNFAERSKEVPLWVPKNYREILIRQAKELLRQCEALNGGEDEDGFEGDQIRLRENITREAEAIAKLAQSARWIVFDKLSHPLELTPQREEFEK